MTDKGHVVPNRFQVRQTGLSATGGPGALPRRVGRDAAGRPLPSIRPLAVELRVNRNTIAKAYAELEAQGVIETIPGKGWLGAGLQGNPAISTGYVTNFVQINRTADWKQAR